MCTYNDSISWNDETRTYSSGIHNGNILLPQLEGKYPLLILFHGMGGAHEWQNNGIISNLNNWIAEDNLIPMVVVMPTLPPNPDGKYNSYSYYNYILNYFSELIEYIGSQFSSYIIDEAKYHAVAGASMGGAGALYSGILYKDYFMHVGGFSPSQDLHRGENDGWIKNPNNLIFNCDPSAVHFMGYSTGEPPEFWKYVSLYYDAFQKNGFIFSKGIVHDQGHGYASFNNQLHLFLKKAFVNET